MTVKFMIPASMIKMSYPDATIILRAAYFGPWNMSPCTVSLSLNNAKKLVKAGVPGEHKGRTTHNIECPEILASLDDQPMSFTLDFNSGNGVLFLWYFEFLIQP